MFVYSLRDLCKNCLVCFCFRSKQNLNKTKAGRKEIFFKKGQKKLDRDLDIVNLINLMKSLRIMRQVLFSANQLYFLKF